MTGEGEETRVDSLRLLEHEIGMLLRRVRRVLAERADLVHEGMSATGYSILATLVEFGPQRASELAETYELDKGAVSRIVHQLCQLGLIDRTPDPEDGRATILEVTGFGRQRMQEVAELRRRQMSERLGDWSTSDLERFIDGLARYNAALAH